MLSDSELYAEKRNYCPISPKLSKIEIVLHEIVSQLYEIFENDNQIDEIAEFSEIKFHNLGACRYSIEDAQSAIDEYKGIALPNNGGYLLYYGLLQAMYVQQDSLKSLYYLIFNRKKKKGTKSFFYDFNKIREIRKNVLHSTDRLSPDSDEKEYFRNYAIYQSEMTKQHFRILARTKSINKLTKIEYEEESKTEIVDLYELIELQENILFRELEKYLNALKTSTSFSQLENL